MNHTITSTSTCSTSNDTSHNEETTTTSTKSDKIILPRNNKEYGTKEYWEHRFRTEESFEWLLSYSQIQHQLEPILLQYCHIPQEPTNDDDVSPSLSPQYDKSKVRILIVGCGNAPFSADLYDNGYTNIINIDYSCTVIQNMQTKHSLLRPNMQWIVMDMTQMNIQPMDDNNTTTNNNTSNNENNNNDTIQYLPKSSFDVVIDKAAMDAIMTNEQDVWSPNPNVIHTSYQMLHSISHDILQPLNGTFVQISLSQPHFRKKYLLHSHPDIDDELDDNDNNNNNNVVSNDTTTTTNTNNQNNNYCQQFGWTLQYELAGRSSENETGGMFGHYLYIMKKGPPPPSSPSEHGIDENKRKD